MNIHHEIKPPKPLTSEKISARSHVVMCSRATGGIFIMEVWKDIPGYEGYYQVSNLGNIKSLKCKVNGSDKIKTREKIRCKTKNNRGYSAVGLYRSGHNKTAAVHRLVAQAFIPNPKNKPCTNHKNGIKTDNKVDNLEWVTHKENANHAYRTGLTKPQWLGKFGKDNFGSKPVIQMDLEGNIIKEFNGMAEAYRETNIPASNISFACSGRYKTAGGYKWKFKQKK